MGRGEKCVREHIATVARRAPSEYALLADALQTVTWPDGGIDRRDADARSWLHRYMERGDRGPQPIPRACGCALGRCLVCN
ncbi:MAG TPA: hypothetical protein VH247_02120 [Thermoleophilaceae bacterium]|jgi:hypothetical protein|nr:hypothetical protein [Thermoleophilaceae bacterium]